MVYRCPLEAGKTSSEEGLGVSPAFHSCLCVDALEEGEVGSTARSQGKAGGERCSAVRRGVAGRSAAPALRCAWSSGTTARTLKSAMLK